MQRIKAEKAEITRFFQKPKTPQAPKVSSLLPLALILVSVRLYCLKNKEASSDPLAVLSSRGTSAGLGSFDLQQNLEVQFLPSTVLSERQKVARLLKLPSVYRGCAGIREGERPVFTLRGCLLKIRGRIERKTTCGVHSAQDSASCHLLDQALLVKTPDLCPLPPPCSRGARVSFQVFY